MKRRYDVESPAVVDDNAGTGTGTDIDTDTGINSDDGSGSDSNSSNSSSSSSDVDNVVFTMRSNDDNEGDSRSSNNNNEEGEEKSTENDGDNEKSASTTLVEKGRGRAHKPKHEDMLTMFVKKPSLSKQLRTIIQSAEVGRTISRSSRYSKQHKLYSGLALFGDGVTADEDDDADAEIDDLDAGQSFIHTTRKKETEIVAAVIDETTGTLLTSSIASSSSSSTIQAAATFPAEGSNDEQSVVKPPSPLFLSRQPLAPCLEFDRVCMDALEAPLAAELRKLEDFIAETCGKGGTLPFALPLVPVAVVSTGMGATDYEFMMDRVGAAVARCTGALVDVNLPLFGAPKDLVRHAAQSLAGKSTAALLVRNVEGCRTAPAAVGALLSLLYEARQRCSAVVVLGVSHAAGLDLEAFLEHSPAAASLTLTRSFTLSSAATVMDTITRRVLAQWSSLPSTDTAVTAMASTGAGAEGDPQKKASRSSAVGPSLLRYALRFYYERSGSVTSFVSQLRQGLQLASRTASTGADTAAGDEKRARRRLREFALLFRLFCHFCTPRDGITQVLYRTLSYGRLGGVQSAEEAVRLAQTRTSDRAHSGDPLAKAWLRTEGVKATKLIALLQTTAARDGRGLPGVPLDSWAAELAASLKNYAAAKALGSSEEISQVTVGELLTREVSAQLAGDSLRILTNSGSGGSELRRRKKWNLTTSSSSSSVSISAEEDSGKGGKKRSPTQKKLQLQQPQQPRLRARFFEIFGPLFVLGDDPLLEALRPTPTFLYANDVREIVLRTLTRETAATAQPMEVEEEKANEEVKKTGEEKNGTQGHMDTAVVDDAGEGSNSRAIPTKDLAAAARLCFAKIASKDKATLHELQECCGNDPGLTDAALDFLLQLGLIYVAKAHKNVVLRTSFPFAKK